MRFFLFLFFFGNWTFPIPVSSPFYMINGSSASLLIFQAIIPRALRDTTSCAHQVYKRNLSRASKPGNNGVVPETLTKTHTHTHKKLTSCVTHRQVKAILIGRGNPVIVTFSRGVEGEEKEEGGRRKKGK